LELSVSGVTKRFGSLIAVNDCSLRVPSDRIFALIGPNGSGKTTLFNVITGFLSPEAGEVALDGKNITGRDPARIAKMGMVRTFQIPRVFANLTVEENLRVANSRIQDIRLNELLELVALKEMRERKAGHLSYGQKKGLDLARALAIGPSLVLLDEPTAGIEPAKIQSIMKQIREIHTMGAGVFIIEHNMSVTMNLADYIYVLNSGVKIAEGPPQQIQSDERVIDAYFGRARSAGAVK
jgi:ABC-type branched-subunit amino acid transport system ATPase component